MLWSFGQVRATMLHPGMHSSSIFNTQHVATRHNRVAKRTQHVAPDNVAIVWQEVANIEPTMLGYVVLRCGDRLNGALRRKCLIYIALASLKRGKTRWI